MHSSISSSDRESSAPSALRQTAADRPGVAQPVPERPVPSLPWRGMLLAALTLAVLSLAGWEIYWRCFGALPGYRNDSALWAIERRRVEAEPDATVLVGSSRVFFDVQLPVWQRLSGRGLIQLAVEGTSPLFALEDLADDASFKGRVLVGVTPDVFFEGFEYRRGLIKFTRHESPSDRVGKWLSMHLVEPYFAFYDADFALFTVIKRQPWPLRPGRESFTSVRKLLMVGPHRNGRMWDKLETDPEYKALARRIWDEEFHDPPPTPKEAADNQRTLELQITRAAAAVAKLRARGIPVLFLRSPSTGNYLEFERRMFPRETTWDALLAKTGAPGIHFEDYPALQGFDLPDWSHIAGSQADRYTAELYAIIDREYGAPNHVHW